MPDRLAISAADNQEEEDAVQFPADNWKERKGPQSKLELDARMRDISNPYAPVDARIQTRASQFSGLMLQVARARQNAYGLKPGSISGPKPARNRG